MSEKSESTTLRQLTLFAEDSLARTSVRQMLMARDWTEAGPDYGQNSCEYLAAYDPNTQSWKTPQISLTGGLTVLSENFPVSGLTRNGNLYQRAPSVLHIHGLGCSLWLTPTSNDRKGAGPKETTEMMKWEAGDRTVKTTYVRLRSQVAAREGHIGMMNPAWIEWLMGLPPRWTEVDLEHSETP